MDAYDGNWEEFDNSLILGKRARSVSNKKKYFTLFFRTIVFDFLKEILF